MKKRFKGKTSINFFKYIIYIFIIALSFKFITSYKTLKFSDNNKLLSTIINNSNYHVNYEKNNNGVIKLVSKFLSSFDVNKPSTIFEKSIIFNQNKANANIENLNNNDENIITVDKENTTEPMIYIYNSHPQEQYSKKGYESQDVFPNVIMASNMLKDKLDKLNIPTVVEESDLIEFLKINNWNHNDSYKASRFYVTDALIKYPNLKLIIDLHRDALTKEQSTIKINDKFYAKTLFLVGTNHPNSDENLKLVNQLNEIFKTKYPNLSRGIYKRHIKETYNQDLSSKVILLEVGGQHNTVDEVLNTVDAVSLVIKEMITNET